MIKLSSGSKKIKYKIVDILEDDKEILKQLNNLALGIGAIVEIKAFNFLKRTIMIESNYISYGLDGTLCNKIMVDEAHYE